jgi:hypothetical protein
MRPHYHLFMGSVGSAPMQNVTFSDYDSSVRSFVHLCNDLYSDYNHDITYVRALEATKFGEGDAVSVGTNILCVQWSKCTYPCLSPSWN